MKRYVRVPKHSLGYSLIEPASPIEHPILDVEEGWTDAPHLTLYSTTALLEQHRVLRKLSEILGKNPHAPHVVHFHSDHHSKYFSVIYSYITMPDLLQKMWDRKHDFSVFGAVAIKDLQFYFGQRETKQFHLFAARGALDMAVIYNNQPRPPLIYDEDLLKLKFNESENADLKFLRYNPITHDWEDE